MTKEEKYVSLCDDTTFKYLFKSKEFRPFLEEVIKLSTGIDIKGYSLIDNELNSGNEVKDYRLDILLEKGDSIISIEMNNEYSESVEIKNRKYLYRVIGSDLLEGKSYRECKKIIQINFNNGYCKKIRDLDIGIFSMSEEHHPNIKIEDIKIYGIYLPKFRDMCYHNANKLNRYLSMFNAESYEELREAVGNDKEAMKVEDELRKLSENEKFYYMYDHAKVEKKLQNSIKEEFYEDGLIQGREEGIKETQMATAKSMLEKGLDINLISEVTKLTINEIEELANN